MRCYNLVRYKVIKLPGKGETKIMKKKSGKGFSVVTVIFSIATILICTLIATLGVLDIAEVMPMYSTYYHKYTYYIN